MSEDRVEAAKAGLWGRPENDPWSIAGACVVGAGLLYMFGAFNDVMCWLSSSRCARTAVAAHDQEFQSAWSSFDNPTVRDELAETIRRRGYDCPKVTDTLTNVFSSSSTKVSLTVQCRVGGNPVLYDLIFDVPADTVSIERR